MKERDGEMEWRKEEKKRGRDRRERQYGRLGPAPECSLPSAGISFSPWHHVS